MPIAGDIVTTSMAAAAREQLTGIAERLSTDLMPAFCKEGPELAPISRKEFTAAIKMLEDAFIWRNDGMCAGRAILGARLLQETLGAAHDDAAIAATAVARGPLTYGSGANKATFDYHAVTVVNVEGSLHVFDPMLFAKPLSYERWQNSLGYVRHGFAIQQTRCIAGFNVDFGRAGAIKLGEYLARSWERAAEEGRVDNSLLQVANSRRQRVR